jgi:hypothetical protein
MLAYEGQKILSDGTLGLHGCEICTTKDQHAPGGRIWPVIHWRQLVDFLLPHHRPHHRHSGGRILPVVHWRGRALQLAGHGHYLIRSQNVVYMAPALVLHYILDHHYRPPDEFVDAVVVGAFLTPEDLA